MKPRNNIGNHHFFTKTCHRQTYKNYYGPLQSHHIDIYLLALRGSLIGLTMTCFSEKNIISYSCIRTWFYAQLAQKILNGMVSIT